MPSEGATRAPDGLYAKERGYFDARREELVWSAIPARMTPHPICAVPLAGGSSAPRRNCKRTWIKSATTTRLHIRRRSSPRASLARLTEPATDSVPPAGIEPATHGLGNAVLCPLCRLRWACGLCAGPARNTVVVCVGEVPPPGACALRQRAGDRLDP